MSNAKRPFERAIRGYDDDDQHSKKRLGFPKETIDTAESEPSGHTDEAFSSIQVDTILENLRAFKRPEGLKITNCIFGEDNVEICYIFDGATDHNKDELRKHLSDHLKINSTTIKMTKLLSKPIYTDTTCIGPGGAAIVVGQFTQSCKIGAFVRVDGKGIHALMSGHGKNVGDAVLGPNGNLLGNVSVSLHPPLQPSADPNWCIYKDVALVHLDERFDYRAQIVDGTGGQVGLAGQPMNADPNMMVRRFSQDGRRGRTEIYAILDNTYNIESRLISVVGANGGPIHEEGESGILVVTDPPVNGRVNAVGILVQLAERQEDNPERTIRRTSLAVPLPANFEALCNHHYCNGATITFL